MIIGSHVSFSQAKQLLGSVEEAISYGANAFMFYTGAPQNTTRVPINKLLSMSAMELMAANNIKLENIVIHAPYIINLANNEKQESYEFAKQFLRTEIIRCQTLGIDKLVLHPGSSVNLSKEEGLKNIVSALNEVLKQEDNIYICLETMAGKGSELGTNLDEIKYMIDNTILNEKIKVCLDTCHLNDAGYDMSKFDEFLTLFDKKIGINKIACVHINDSMNLNNSHKDRHANIGFGTLGFSNIMNIIYNSKLENIPKILETPYVPKDALSKVREYPPYKFEIEMIKRKKWDMNLIEKIRKYYK